MIDTQGKLLVAPPNMTDWRFQKSVIYMWRHDVMGAAGVMVNKAVKTPSWETICREGSITRTSDKSHSTWYGGPILTSLIGVLHTSDWHSKTSNGRSDDPARFTLDRDILEAIARDEGPKQSMITIGMANWEAGQLELEIEAQPPRPATMSWLMLDFDEDLVFGEKQHDFWDMCVSRAIQNKTKEITSKVFKD
jgi:putative transcriptional regulator